MKLNLQELQKKLSKDNFGANFEKFKIILQLFVKKDFFFLMKLRSPRDRSQQNPSEFSI